MRGRRGQSCPTTPALWGRGWYFEHIAVDPRNADIVYVPNVALLRSMDGGKTWVALSGSPGGDDYQGAWVSPDDSDTMVVASDQGTIITRNATTEDPRDVTWSSWLTSRRRRFITSRSTTACPYWVTGAQQDSGAVAVRSRGKFAAITMRDWEPIGAGGESGMTAGDPLHPGIVFGGLGTRYDLELNAPLPDRRSCSPDSARTDWTQPLVFSKADPQRALLRESVSFPDDRWRANLDPDQPGPDTTRSGRARRVSTQFRRRTSIAMAIAASSTRSVHRR